MKKRVLSHNLKLVTPLLVLLALSGAAVADEDTFDILGFRLGMTPDEAEAVFRHLNPEVELNIDHGYYRYSDGLQDIRTEPFLEKIRGTIRYNRETKTTLYVAVEFSPPPDGGKVVQVIRQDSNIANPVTLAEYSEALVAKYGAPATRQYGLQWHFPDGRSFCSNSASGPVSGNLGTLAQGRDREQKLADPSRCASYLTFRMTGDPVVDVYARMVDVEHAIRAQLAAGAWVAGLQAEAVAAREAQGRRPEL
jgi:hypothetical protein